MKLLKLWVDDIRTPPSPGEDWVHVRSTHDAIGVIKGIEKNPYEQLVLIDLDHDAGDYVLQGGDYIEILNWLERTKRTYPIHIHSMNPVGVQNMRAIIRHNGWTEV